MTFRKLASRCSGTLLVCASLVLAGCDRSTESSQVNANPAAADPGELDIAAAADLKFALDQVARKFRQDRPAVNVRITYGSSGNFYTQLASHAPFDLFFSADKSYPDKLIEAGLGARDSEFIYGVGQIVLWAPNKSGTQLSLRSLVENPALKIAIANPRHAPYGRAAEAALRKHKLWDELQPRLVMGENIAQTAQFVQSGAADLGIIALSLALSPPMRDAGSYFIFPREDYPPLEQAGVILSFAKHPGPAAEFKKYITGPEGLAMLKQYGFEFTPR